ncbi:MAG: hypothetical protein U0N59_09990, partial [Oscillospiraceae bacterium]
PLLRRRWWNGATARTVGRSDRDGGVHDAAPFSCFAFGAPKSSPTRAQIGRGGIRTPPPPCEAAQRPTGGNTAGNE